MADHFAIVTWARDAVINADMGSLREPMRLLAQHEYEDVPNGAWIGPIMELQEAAQLTAEAGNLAVAAMGVANMARVCGNCHQRSARGPRFDTDFREATAPRPDTMGTRMYRHMWAVDRLWEGLTGPSDSSWSAGAQVLAHAPTLLAADEAPSREVLAELQQVRDWGARAVDATTSTKRAELYGELLSTCARCHAQQAEIEF